MSTNRTHDAERLDYRPAEYRPGDEVVPAGPAIAAALHRLPPLGAGEVEIARLELATHDVDVIAVRAIRAGALYHYRMVDAHLGRWVVAPRTSREPLTTEELMKLIDGARFAGVRWDDLTDTIRDCAGDDIPRSAAFVTVRSNVYPALERLYRSKASAWLARRLRSPHPLATAPGAPRCGVA